MRQILTILAWLLILGGVWPAMAMTAPGRACLNADKVQDLLHRFEILDWRLIQKAGGSWERVESIDLCDEAQLTHQVLEALDFLSDQEFQKKLTDDFDHDFLGNSPLDFFQKRIRSLKVESLGSPFCRTSTVAFVVTGEESQNVMHVCPYANQFSTLMVTEILLHEARHIDGFPHVQCLSGLYEGAAACDPSYEMGGSYGIGTEFLVKMARAPQASLVVQQEARAEAVAELLVRFAHAPLDIQEGSLLLSEDGTLSFFDGIKALSMVEKIPATTKVVLREIPAFFDTLSGQVLGFSAGSGMTNIRGPFAQDFRSLPAERQRRLLDAVYGSADCFLFDDSIRCLQGATWIDWKLPKDLKPVGLMPIASAGSGVVYIVDENGEQWRLPAARDIRMWKPEQIEKNDEFTRVHFGKLISFNGLLLGLSVEGTLIRNVDPRVGWVPHPSFVGQKFRNLMAPFFWSQRVQEL